MGSTVLAVGLAALLAGGMDPSYRDLAAEPARAIGRSVDWTVRLTAVTKRYYTYHLRGAYLAPPGEPRCEGCWVTIVFRGLPAETARPSRFAAGQVVRVRGTVYKVRPEPTVVAGKVSAPTRQP
ncbi:MAG: hypothetical protein FJZ01_16405 [Candidatus Sericytochromatia bacterium]|nr:hypothetical protein [Candidatus Tanganyikabacteria bacterium]